MDLDPGACSVINLANASVTMYVPNEIDPLGDGVGRATARLALMPQDYVRAGIWGAPRPTASPKRLPSLALDAPDINATNATTLCPPNTSIAKTRD